MNNGYFLRYFSISFLVLCCLWVASCSHGFKNDDKASVTMNTLISMATDMSDNGDTKGAIRFMDSAFAAKASITVSDRYYYYHYMHEVYDRLNDHEKDQRYIDSMLRVIEQTGNQHVLVNEYAMANFAMADKLLAENNFNEAYKYYYVAKTVAEENKDSCVLAHYVYKTGLALYKGEQYAKAIPYFIESYKMFESCEPDNFTAFYRLQEILDDIGLCYTHNNEHDSAIVYYKEALKLVDEHGRKVFPIGKERLLDMADAVIYGNLGGAYMEVGDYKQAEDYMTRSIAVNKQKNYDNKDAQLTRIKLAALYIKEKRLNESKHLLDTVAQTLDTNYVVKIALRWNNVMWQFWQAQNKPEYAFAYLLRHKQLTDSLDAVNKKVRVVDIDSKVVSLEKQNEINVLQKQDDSKKIYLIIAVFACIMAVSIIFLVQKNVKESKMHVRVLQELNNRISEQKRTLQKTLDDLNKAGKEKDRILKAVSHDMRSPVNSALALTELLLSSKEHLIEEQVGYLELLRDSCNNALSLTKDLLEVATFQDEQMPKEPTDVNMLTRNVVELLRFKAAEKRQTIELDVYSEPVIALLNKEKVSRVIGNLVNNAIKFSPADTTIFVKVGTNKDALDISIQDQGIGIPAEIKDKIFDIFTEAKRFGTSGEQPYGLGLSISKQIVEAHKGSIWFDSETSKGSIFHISIPLI